MMTFFYNIFNIVKSIYSLGCVISEGETFLLTGGAIPDSFGESIGTVARYSQWTWLDSLDDLNTARQSHACGFFTTSDNKRVRV